MSNKLSLSLLKHECFSLVYYIYGWGFDKYVGLVSKFKNVIDDKWSKNEKGESVVENIKFRIEFFTHVFDYMNTKNMIEEAKKLTDTILSWKPTSKAEEKRNESFFGNMSSNHINHTADNKDFSKNLKDYVFGKYFIDANRRGYERSNSW